jgi:hypothetical protein
MRGSCSGMSQRPRLVGINDSAAGCKQGGEVG